MRAILSKCRPRIFTTVPLERLPGTSEDFTLIMGILHTQNERGIDLTSIECLRMLKLENFKFYSFIGVNRLARDTEVSLKTARELKEMGIKVIFVRENIDFDAPGAQQEFTKLALNAEEYSAGIAADVNRSIRYKLDRGEAWGRPPFGYQICDDDCPDDDEHPFWHQHDVKAPLVKAMFERYDKGDSLAQIARWLNSSGHKTNKMNADMSGVVIEGNAFRSESVGYILRNRKYIGFAKNPRGGTDERTANHKPIVSKALFESVNSRLLKNTAKREAAGRKSKSARILSRIVHCYICDSQYSVSTGGKGCDYHLRRKKWRRLYL